MCNPNYYSAVWRSRAHPRHYLPKVPMRGTFSSSVEELTHHLRPASSHKHPRLCILYILSCRPAPWYLQLELLKKYSRTSFCPPCLNYQLPSSASTYTRFSVTVLNNLQFRYRYRDCGGARQTSSQNNLVESRLRPLLSPVLHHALAHGWVGSRRTMPSQLVRSLR